MILNFIVEILICFTTLYMVTHNDSSKSEKIYYQFTHEASELPNVIAQMTHLARIQIKGADFNATSHTTYESYNMTNNSCHRAWLLSFQRYSCGFSMWEPVLYVTYYVGLFIDPLK